MNKTDRSGGRGLMAIGQGIQHTDLENLFINQK